MQRTLSSSKRAPVTTVEHVGQQRVVGGPRKYMKLTVITTLLVVLLTGLVGASAGAQSGPTEVAWSVSTSTGDPNYRFEVTAGDTVTDEFVIANHSTVNLVLGVYASDAYTTDSGDTDLLQAGEPSSGVGSWVFPEENTVTVNAGEEVAVPFEIVVPASAASGDHVGGIVTSLVLSEPDSDGQQVAIERRLGSRIYVRVSGQAQASVEFANLELDYNQSWNPFGGGSLTATYTLNNTGNMVIQGGGQATAKPSMGGEATAQLDEIDELLPGNSVTKSVVIPGVFPGFGTQVEVQFYPTVNDQSASDAVTVEPLLATAETSLFPLPQLILILVVIFLIVAVVLWWRSNKASDSNDNADSKPEEQAWTTPDTPPPVPPVSPFADPGTQDLETPTPVFTGLPENPPDKTNQQSSQGDEA